MLLGLGELHVELQHTGAAGMGVDADTMSADNAPWDYIYPYASIHPSIHACIQTGRQVDIHTYKHTERPKQFPT